jgi:hypothetical protein
MFPRNAFPLSKQITALSQPMQVREIVTVVKAEKVDTSRSSPPNDTFICIKSHRLVLWIVRLFATEARPVLTRFATEFAFRKSRGKTTLQADRLSSEKPKLPQGKPAGFIVVVVAESQGGVFSWLEVKVTMQ